MKFSKAIATVRQTVAQANDAPDYDIDNPPPGETVVINVAEQLANENLVRALMEEVNYDDDADPVAMSRIDAENDDDF